MEIKKINDENMSDVVKLVSDVFMEFEAPGYSEEGVNAFFVDGRYHRRGIGSKLFRVAAENSTADKMTVNSSPYAKEVYHHLGFRDTDEEQIVTGIRFIPMMYTNINKEGKFYVRKDA